MPERSTWDKRKWQILASDIPLHVGCVVTFINGDIDYYVSAVSADGKRADLRRMIGARSTGRRRNNVATSRLLLKRHSRY